MGLTFCTPVHVSVLVCVLMPKFLSPTRSCLHFFNKSRWWVWRQPQRWSNTANNVSIVPTITQRTWWSSRWCWRRLPGLLGFCICVKGFPRFQLGAGKDWSKPRPSPPASFIKSFCARLKSLFTSSSETETWKSRDNQNPDVYKRL